MIKTILIDDEPLARVITREYLQSYSDIEIVAECNDGFEGVKAIAQHKPDLIFLDIQMPKINGFEMLELLEQPPSVIFTTAFDEYAMKAFEAHAIDYLLKPFNKERLTRQCRNGFSNAARGPRHQPLIRILKPLFMTKYVSRKNVIVSL
jgi:two-component system, LytTR family, response regulator